MPYNLLLPQMQLLPGMEDCVQAQIMYEPAAAVVVPGSNTGLRTCLHFGRYASKGASYCRAGAQRCTCRTASDGEATERLSCA